jgi:hypothetical protein
MLRKMIVILAAGLSLSTGHACSVIFMAAISKVRLAAASDD